MGGLIPNGAANELPEFRNLRHDLEASAGPLARQHMKLTWQLARIERISKITTGSRPSNPHTAKPQIQVGGARLFFLPRSLRC